MDSYKANDSLDNQVNSVYRQRPKMGFFKKLVAGVTLLATTLCSCVRYDLHYVPSPDSMAQQVTDYQDNLDNIAAADPMKMYDPATKKYDANKVKEQVGKQTEKDASGKKYKNLSGYKLDQLLAVKKALEVLTEEAEKLYTDETDPAKKQERKKEYDELSKLKDSHQKVLKRYHALGYAQPGADNLDRQRNILALEVLAYSAEDFDKWEKLVKQRKRLGGLGDSSEYSSLALQYPDEVREAHGVREQVVAASKERRKQWWKKNWWWVTLLAVGGACAAAQDDEGNSGTAGDIGGEDGGPGGKGLTGFRF
ncbi:hypothetical protein KY343_05815 [Candidatus Woesearchaeota archaeon]|nr:hypothetical protein [Candidatus Woesearchaeota archaeon]